MKRIKIFISYAHVDRGIVDIINDELNRIDYKYLDLIDNTALIANETPFHVQINNLIKESDIALLILTENYLSSRACEHELAIIDHYAKKVLPIAIGDVEIPQFLLDRQVLRISNIDEVGKKAAELLLGLEWLNNSMQSTQTTYKAFDRQTKWAIDKLKKALNDSKLTLVCGAGVSIPSGISSWHDLLVTMVDNTLFDGANSQSAEELLANLSQSSIIIGKYLRIILGNDFESNLKKAMYKYIDNNDKSCSYADTELMEAVIELAKPRRRGRYLDSIITFNFDDVIETKLRKLKIDCCSLWKEGQSYDVNELPIYHVHGFLPYQGEIDEPNIVFSEEAYHSQFIDPYSWANLLQLNTFANNVCLFVGLSMTDPNLRRLLDISWRHNHNRRHFVILKKSHSDIVNGFVVRDANSLGLNVIWCDNFDEIPKIILDISD